MRTSLSRSVAALFAAGFVTFATAQAAPAQPEPAVAPTYVSEPVASAYTTIAAPDQRVTDMVQALNADASLKNSKITVQMDGQNILLTGASQTEEQVKRAGELAAQGGATVINAIVADRVATKVPAAAAPQVAG